MTKKTMYGGWTMIPKVSWLVVLTAWLAATSAAHAYFVEARGAEEAVPVYYDTATPVEFRIVTAGMPVEGAAAIEAAFATWAGVDCSGLDFVRGADVSNPDPSHWITDGGERYALVYWPEESGGIFTGTRETMVGFFFFAHDGTGKLIGATVMLNRRYQWSTSNEGEADKLDVQSVVTALIGRSLGITSSLEGNATYPRYPANDVSKRILGQDDVDAVTFLYGDGSSCDAIPPEAMCMSGESTCPPPPPVVDDPAPPPPPIDDPPPTVDDPMDIPPPLSGDGGVDPMLDDPAGGPSAGSGGCSAGTTRAASHLGLTLVAFGVVAVATRRRRR